MKKPLFLALAAASAVIGSSAASAAELQFVFTQTDTNGVTDFAIWTTSLTPDVLSSTLGESTTIAAKGTDVVYSGLVNYAKGTITSVTFFNFPPGGFFDNAQITVVGDQVFSGTDADPIFSVGTYSVSLPNSKTLGSLTISIVPEPATWAMMLVGLGMIGFATRRRQKVSVSYA